MIKPVRFAGPWKGMITAMSPDQFPPAYVQYARNFLFKTGKLQLTPPIRHEQYAPRGFAWVPDGDDWRAEDLNYRLEDIVAAKSFETANGSKHILYVENNELWIGGGDRAFRVSQDPKTGTHCGWISKGNRPQILHYVGEVSEWLLISNGVGPYLWRLNLNNPMVFEQFIPEVGTGYIPLMSGLFMETFANRIVFGGPITPGLDQLHGIGWWGISGPFDNSYPSCGTVSLSDLPGNTTGLSRIGEFLAIFKEDGIFLAQKTDVLDNPLAWSLRVTGVGCPYPWTIQRIGNGNALVFISQDRRVCIFDGSQVQVIDDTVRNLVEERDPNLCFTFYDTSQDLYMIIYEDLILEWNTRENWWTTETTTYTLRCATTANVRKKGLAINELEGSIDGLGGTIDELGGDSWIPVPQFIGRYGTGYRYSDAEVEAHVRTAELRLEKPTTITRLILRVRAPKGGKLSIRHSLDGGATWYPWVSKTTDDLTGVARFTYDFVDTSEQFTFEIKVIGRDVIIEDAVVDVTMHDLQEGNVTLFTNADFTTSRGIGV